MALVYDPTTGRMVERPDHRQAMAARLNQTRETVGGLASAAFGAATAVPRTLMGIATGDIPVTFDSRLPGQDTRDRIRADLQSAQNARWVENNPQAAEQARGFGLGVAQRTVAQGLQPPGGYPGVSTPMPAPVATQAPTTNPDSLPPNATEADRIAAITAASTQAGAAPLDVPALNRGLADAISATRADAPIYQPQERGNYNMYNTDQAALASRAAPTAGINFGFGVNGAPTARDYLETMRAQDAAEARATEIRRAQAQADVARIGIRNRMESDDPFVRRAARDELAALEGRLGMQVSETAATDRQQMQGDTSRDVAGIQGQFGLAQAGVQAEGGITQQQIASDQRAQQVAAMLAQEQAQFEANPTNRRNAIASSLAQAMLEAGDVQGAISALYGTQPAATPRPETRILQGPTGEAIGVSVNGVPRPFTPEEIAALTEAQRAYRAPAP